MFLQGCSYNIFNLEFGRTTDHYHIEHAKSRRTLLKEILRLVKIPEQGRTTVQVSLIRSYPGIECARKIFVRVRRNLGPRLFAVFRHYSYRMGVNSDN